MIHGYSQAFQGLYGPKPIEKGNKMNEQLRDRLIRAAGFHFRPSIENTVPGIDWNCGSWGYDQCVDRLIELVVRECIKESLEEIVSDDEIEEENDPIFKEYFKGNNQGIVDAVVRFRNHFGVKP